MVALYNAAQNANSNADQDYQNAQVVEHDYDYDPRIIATHQP